MIFCSAKQKVLSLQPLQQVLHHNKTILHRIQYIPIWSYIWYDTLENIQNYGNTLAVSNNLFHQNLLLPNFPQQSTLIDPPLNPRERRSAAGCSVVSYPTRWSLLFVFGFLWWSSSQQQRNIVQQCTRCNQPIVEFQFKIWWWVLSWGWWWCSWFH